VFGCLVTSKLAVRFAECGGGDGERGCGDGDLFTTYVAFRSGTDEITERLKQPISGVCCSVICVESAGPLEEIQHF